MTSVDVTHDRYIVAALARGRGVITEKPMTTDAQRCDRILRANAEARAKGRPGVAVTFNYRYNPVHERVRELLADGAVGRIGSVHFEWLLDVLRRDPGRPGPGGAWRRRRPDDRGLVRGR